VNPINWLWLEDLLVRAFELELRAFADNHSGESFFAVCLEFDGLNGSLGLSYGTRRAVDEGFLARQAKREGVVYYRAVELRPEHWSFRLQPVLDPEGVWRRLQPAIERYAGLMQEDLDPEVAEFLWLRFEYLADSVLQRLTERGAFRYLGRDAEFITYSANEHEALEELEDRIVKCYPHYNRATVELVDHPRPGELPATGCEAVDCPDPLAASLARCTHCQQWLCEGCRSHHTHPELFRRGALFNA
jgi:hypothetical protein